jgi:hypothetical protein
MDYDKSKVDEMTLALMFLTSFTAHEITRSWKGYDWDAMGRLHEAGMICDPVGKAKSVVLTEEGEKRSRELFQQHFLQSKSDTAI